MYQLNFARCLDHGLIVTIQKNNKQLETMIKTIDKKIKYWLNNKAPFEIKIENYCDIIESIIIADLYNRNYRCTNNMAISGCAKENYKSNFKIIKALLTTKENIKMKGKVNEDFLKKNESQIKIAIKNMRNSIK